MSGVIDGFEINYEEILGHGTYGTVYEAKRIATGEPAAAKQALIRSVAKDVPRILQEVDNMKAVSHENLVRYLHHHDSKRGQFWVFVELCDLGDLDHYFVEKNPDRHEYLQLMKQMSTAIVYLHEKGIVHRDIKPGNILLQSGKHGVVIVKIGDFGLAKLVVLRNTDMLSFSTMNAGTRVYMAPELFAITPGSQDRCDKFVDIFALGITFFAIICLKKGGIRMIPSEDPASCPESGYGHQMAYMRDNGNLEKAESYHEEVVEVKGDDLDRKIRELIRVMIPFHSTHRVEASVVLNTLNDIILKSDKTDGADTYHKDLAEAAYTVKKKADDSGIGRSEPFPEVSPASTESQMTQVSGISIEGVATSSEYPASSSSVASERREHETDEMLILSVMCDMKEDTTSSIDVTSLGNVDDKLEIAAIKLEEIVNEEENICELSSGNFNSFNLDNLPKVKSDICSDTVSPQVQHDCVNVCDMEEDVTCSTGVIIRDCKMALEKLDVDATMIAHELTRICEKRFQCQYCDYSTRQKGHLVVHERTHTGEKPFQCQYCSYSAPHKSNLVVHERKHTGEKLIQCQYCDYSTSVKWLLVVHERKHTAEKSFQCQYCDYSTPRKSHLVRHERVHSGEKSFQCQYCDYSTPHKSHLVVHERKHTGEKPFQCQYCDFSSADKSYLVVHERKHTGEKAFKCQYCDYYTGSNSRLVSHERVHTGEKPFQCQYCDYSARQKGNLVVHVRKHTGEKLM